MYGGWKTGEVEYIDSVYRYQFELGQLDFASPQDWMCEPQILKQTGLTVKKHQQHTISNYIALTILAPDLPFIPVLQGWNIADYHAHLEMYRKRGVDLTTEPLVGLGSVCRRQATKEIAELVSSLYACGLKLHGFGVKTNGLAQYKSKLTSCDSMAWSFTARMEPPLPGCVGHKSCNNCMRYAEMWRKRVLAK